MKQNEQRLSLALAPRPVKYFDSVASTNDIATDWLRDGALKGAVVIADEQTAGRGRLGRTWHTPPGVAIAASVILRTEPQRLPQINMVGTLAVSNLLRALNLPDVSIKWPNDVLVDGRKICGILPEAVWSGDQLDGVVLGIGLNVRNDFTDTPLAETATTIEAITGKTQDRAALLAVLLFHLDAWLAKLGSEEVISSYKSRLSTLGHTITVSRTSGETISGMAVDVQTDGGLVIETDAGDRVTMYDGDVTVSSGS
ncbi:MAG: biotin--[acetyl-CoA-carboxylase] ligase [Chloroflexota bacterium]